MADHHQFSAFSSSSASNPVPIIENAPPPSELEDTDGTSPEVESTEQQQNFLINKTALERILLDPKIADKKVCVVSVAGAFRTGKSFILNFFLRYLRWCSKKSQSESEDGDWLRSGDSQLKGFSWRGGDDRDTNGILIWPEPFILEDRNGEEVAVIIMDTQGIFDCISTVKSNATIFALSTMISSVQVFNINKTIQEDHLQHLQLFTEYARLALDEYNDAKPFQSLLFLVRDWSFPYDADYGINGGQRILDKRLEVTPKQHPELQQLRRHIRSSFDSIRCFLMPHPGLEVSTSPVFRGELKMINSEFQGQLRTLVPHLFDPNNLVVKSIRGQPVTCRELSVYINAYFEVFRGAELPEPKTILNATAEANNLAAVVSAKAVYIREMEEVCGGDTPFMSGAELRSEHARCRAEAVRTFQSTKKMGGPELAAQFLDKLDADIQEAFESFERNNNSKNLFKTMRTPAVLVSAIIFLYMCQEFFQLFGMDMIASVFSLSLTLIIVALGTWTYSRYSGQFREAQRLIDEWVTFAWTNVIAPAFVNHAGGAALNMTTGGNFTLPSANATSSSASGIAKKGGETKKFR